MSKALTEFTTLLQSTGPAWLGGVEQTVNDVSLATYTQPHLTAHQADETMIQGGDQIQAMVHLDLTSTYTRYDPNPTINYQNAQPGTPITIPWSFAYAYAAWTKQEVGLNREMATPKARARRYKSVMYQKYTDLWTDVCNQTEAEYWATPDFGSMEAATAVGVRVPYSLPVFITEFDDALPFGFTTVLGINSATTGGQPNWQNQRVEFLDVDTGLGSINFLHGFKALRQATQFDRLPKKSGYGEGVSNPGVYFTSSWGDRLFERAMVENNDSFFGGEHGRDAGYSELKYRNVPLIRITTLDTAALYRDDRTTPTAFADEAGADFTGPRVYAVNCPYVVPFFHSDNYGTLGKPDTPTNQPFSVVQVMDLWNNLGVTSRRRHGILIPGADTSLDA